MNTVFSVDDFSDSFWAAPASDDALGMTRSHSEWALERFLEEFSGAGEAISGSHAGENVIGPSLMAPKSSVSKVEEGDVVEIKRPNSQNHNHPPSDQTPTVPTASDDYHTILKSKLELECAAVALSRVFLSFSAISALAVKAEDSSAEAENHALPSGSKVQGMILSSDGNSADSYGVPCYSISHLC
ncbi:hypothetical protein Goari_013843 [Gossypium aridum]|uniref:Uncharacterized protein n=1 Tax=Gossypium aridum TaxID=34290 RepID=A0A7J8XG09_GOSAI|nr:hypothetical protein [Gossypium aridum]